MIQRFYMLRPIFAEFRAQFVILTLISALSYALSLALPFIMHLLFASITGGYEGFALMAGVAALYYGLTPFIQKRINLYKRHLGVDIRAFVDRSFYKDLQNLTPKERANHDIVSLPFFESYSGQYTVLIFLPDLLWVTLAVALLISLGVLHLGGLVTAAVFLLCAGYTALCIHNVKIIGRCYYQLLDIEKQRVGLLSQITKQFKQLKLGRYSQLCKSLLATIRGEQVSWLGKRAWLQAYNESLIKGFFVLLFSLVILLLSSYGQGAGSLVLDASNLFVLSICLNLLISYLEDAVSTIRVLYNVYLVDKKASRLQQATCGDIKTDVKTDIRTKAQPDELTLPALELSGAVIGLKGDGDVATAICQRLLRDRMAVAAGHRLVVAGSSDDIPKVGYCDQRPFIVSGTVRENVTLHGAKESGEETVKQIDEARLKAVLQRYQLTADVADFAEGQHKQVGESGSNLSTGQRVRVALARLDYLGYEAVILTDVFSCLDPAVAAAIQRELLAVCRGAARGSSSLQTVVFASSNPQHFSLADTVIDLVAGTVVEQQQKPALVSEVVQIGGTAATTPSQQPNSAKQSQEQPEKKSRKFNVLKVLLDYFGPLPLLLLVSLVGLEIYAQINIAKVLGGWRSGAESSFNHQLFYTLGAIALVALVAKNIFVFWQGIATSKRIHGEMMTKLFGLSYQQYKDSGYYLNRLGNDFQVTEMTTPKFLSGLVYSVLATVFGTLFLAMLNPFLGVILVPLGVGCYFFYARHRQRVIASTDAFARSKQPAIQFLSETDDHYHAIGASGLSDWARRRFTGLLELREDAGKQYWRDVIQLDFAAQLLLSLVVIAVLLAIYVSRLVFAGADHSYQEYNMLALFFVLAFRRDISDLLGSLKSVEANLTALERIGELTSCSNQEKSSSTPYSVAPPKAEPLTIAVDELSYSVAGQQVLSRFTAQFRAGEPTLIVGRTGCGKSTLLDLLAGMSTPSSGQINFSSPMQANQVLYIGPHSFQLGVPVSQMLGSAASAEASAAASDVRKFMTEALGANWLAVRAQRSLLELSSADRQLCELLRLLSQNPRLILLDEAFSSIDQQLERKVMAALLRIYSDTAIVYVSHRPKNVEGLFRQVGKMSPVAGRYKEAK